MTVCGYTQEDIDYFRGLELADMQARVQRWRSARDAAEAMAAETDDNDEADWWDEIVERCELRIDELSDDLDRQASNWGFVI